MSELRIDAKALYKNFGNLVAVDGLSFEVGAGEVLGFLGPNGAGKSTTMKMLTGFLAPTSGSARIGGYDTVTERLQAAELIGYLPENGPLYAEMTPASLLRYVGRARGMKSRTLDDRLDYVVD